MRLDVTFPTIGRAPTAETGPNGLACQSTPRASRHVNSGPSEAGGKCADFYVIPPLGF